MLTVVDSGQRLQAWQTGVTLAFSRAVGEYGSIVIVSSNMPLKDLIASVLIFQNLEQYEYTGATVIGTVILLLSLIVGGNEESAACLVRSHSVWPGSRLQPMTHVDGQSQLVM